MQLALETANIHVHTPQSQKVIADFQIGFSEAAATGGPPTHDRRLRTADSECHLLPLHGADEAWQLLQHPPSRVRAHKINAKISTRLFPRYHKSRYVIN